MKKRPLRPALPAGLPLVSILLAACGGSTTAPDPVDPGPGKPGHDLLFEGTHGTMPELWLRDESDGSVRRLLPPGLAATDPQPSPDGTRIAFVVADYRAPVGDIFVVNRDGSGLMQVTFAPELDDQPAWSPDGTRIAFRSFRTQRDGDIWVMDADGGNPVLLTPDPLPGVWDEQMPAWSPDGARIAYVTNAAGNVDLWTMAADGSDPRQITDTIDLDVEPAWSPDGATIAFRRSGPATGSDILLVPAAGGTPVPIVLPGEQRLPVWSPDGDYLVVVSSPTRADRPDLWRVGMDGTGFSALVTDAVPGGSLHPSFLRRI